LLPNPVDWAVVMAAGSNRHDKTIAANKRIFTNLLQKYTSCGYGGINWMDFLCSHSFIGNRTYGYRTPYKRDRHDRSCKPGICSGDF
jgi:hypothetical protein